MTIIRHFRDPLVCFVSMCGEVTAPASVEGAHRLAKLGEIVDCPNCRRIIDFAKSKVSFNYVQFTE